MLVGGGALVQQLHPLVERGRLGLKTADLFATRLHFFRFVAIFFVISRSRAECICGIRIFEGGRRGQGIEERMRE